MPLAIFKQEYLGLAEILNHFGNLGDFSLLWIAKYWTNNLAVWSHLYVFRNMYFVIDKNWHKYYFEGLDIIRFLGFQMLTKWICLKQAI